MSHAEGFYWITDGDGIAEVGQWLDGRWWLTGCEEPALETQITVLGGILVAPASGVDDAGI